ncbi:PREDICTED: regulator of G-protein signaling loco isoform X2 [Trachymyrmex cornetzi]|uniref:regulator of G-protein signaling loco isoform X2 n=1 Tax=Trachymyrmex cornetzi TaxID=471704 RepID=UPI00084EE8EF|nr:PREDICTED: regulator of G-protein signaling loco isoform X2 [Trachymyrmex cornetzi]
MHQNRRKKKRVNYGVRAVEVVRGAKGFGFTISGQQPCILSCIVQGSPAEAAGLRAGDYLVAVNGHNVSKVPHDDVVQLIGSSKGILRLQIAENYYSDSSDEEGLATVRSKPKYAHKPRTASAGALQLQCRAAKVVRDLQSGAMFHTVPGGLAMSDAKDQYNYSGLHYRWNMTSPLPLPPPPASHKRDSEKIVHRTVVGYLGTIDIPNQLHPSCMMQVLRKCIKRLKAEKRNPTTVLLTIHVANIKLTNSENRIIAEYPSYRIIFCNSFSEQDKQYFGILTKSMRNTDDIVSNSCHVFTIYYKLIDHEVHSSACNVFGFMCTKSSELNVCQEFPDSCTSLIGAIQTLYISDCTNGENCTNPYNEARIRLDTASPQPSNISTSTAHSSNSDSGIGFKDDYGSCSSKNLANDCERRRHYSNMQYRNVSARLSKEPVNEAAGHRLTVRATSEARLWSEELKFDPSKEMRHVAGSGEGTTTTCAGTSAPAATARTMFASTSVGSLASVCTTALLDGIEDAAESSKVASTEGLKRLMDATNKLSPKVYCGQVTKSLVHSLEDINSSMEYARQPYCHSYSGKSDKPRPWGSLQEIRNFRSSASDNCIYGSTESCDKNNDCKGVHIWANGFEKLLEDPKGLQTFAEFLKKEFSHENIYFWAACERYKDTKDTTMRRRLACQIYQRHLSNTAAEPVNVDSHASGQITQELLDEAPADLFLQTQKQVFNLMKFDSYPRFLRSELYRACLEAGSAVIDTEDCDLHLTSSPSVKLKKSHSDAEDRRRKSLLPWNRKNRSKSKDRGESEYNKTPSRSETIYKSFTVIKRETEGNNNEDTVSISSSRSSLASWDLALRQSFNKHMVDTKCFSSVLAGQEVEVVPTKVLKVELPSRRIISIIAHKGKTLKEVLRPLLNKYGFNLDLISIWSEGRCVPMDIMAISAPTRIIVMANEEDFQRELHTAKYLDEMQHAQPTLDEITNKVFEELLVGKSRNKYQYSEGSCKSDDQRSEGSSILSSKFFLRDSTIHGKKKAKSKCCNTSEKGNSNDCIHEGAPIKSQPPLIAKWRNGVKLQLPGRFDGDELYEGLKRAQRSRLEDQRGTEINFELPDFLKNKENGKPSDSNKMRRTRVVSANYESTTKFYDSSEDKQSSSGYEYSAHVTNGAANERFSALVNITEPLSKCLESSFNLDCDRTLVDGDQTIIENGTDSPSKSPHSGSYGGTDVSHTKLSKPPPLPPKPKNLVVNVVKSGYITSPKTLQRPNHVIE